MRTINVFLEVDDKVYNLVVEPHKKAKTFSKLMASLLKGYIEDEYVRAYGNSTVDDMKKASVDSLDDAINGMTESLMNLGMFTDELKLTSAKGLKEFKKDKPEAKAESVPTSTTDHTPEDNQLKEEVEELRNTVKDLMKQNAEIMSMLAGKESAVAKAPTPKGTVDKEDFVEEKHTVKESETAPEIKLKEVKSVPDEVFNLFADEEEPKEADGFDMTSILDGVGVTF